jgi:hypothetical protein
MAAWEWLRSLRRRGNRIWNFLDMRLDACAIRTRSAPAKPAKVREKAVAKHGKVAKAPRVKAAEPASSPSGETIMSDDKMAV